MRLIAFHDGKLLTRDSNAPAAGERAFSSGLPELDALAPGGGFARGAVHELLTDPADGKALFFAMLLAAGAAGSFALTGAAPAPASPQDPASSSGVIVWCDGGHEIYPPALAAYGFPLDRLLLLRPGAPDPADRDLIWAVTESLRCQGVAAVVAPLQKLSRIAARRLQLAAEQGGGVGLLLRPAGRASAIHAAATRWLVRPRPGSPTAQRWTIQLLHGHGGRVGQTLCLEHCRETHRLHPFDPVADRQAPPKPKRLAAS